MIIQYSKDKYQKAIQRFLEDNSDKELPFEIEREYHLYNSEHIWVYQVDFTRLRKQHSQLVQVGSDIISLHIEQREIDLLEDYL